MDSLLEGQYANEDATALVELASKCLKYEARDELEELFSSLPDSSCSQFDLEMNAMSDMTSFDSSTYDFLDFNNV